MLKIQTIMSDPRFINRMQEIKTAEQDRIYCRHGFEHLLSVARIAYILAQEEGKIKFDSKSSLKEIIYATALLHDIGRFSDYEKTMNHRIAGALLARPILTDAGFDESEVDEMCDAIKMHGTFPEEKNSFAGIIYRADKLSRSCFDCDAYDSCNWSAEKKNDDIEY